MRIDLISVPIYYGADRAGVELGPQTLLDNGLVSILSGSHQLLSSTIIEVERDATKEAPANLKYLRPIVNANDQLREVVYNSLSNGNMPLTLGGDHSLALGTLAGALKNSEDTLLIWVDAHTDINTHLSTPSGNIHGMPVAAALNFGHPLLTGLFTNFLRPENILYVGVRSIDEGERDLINKLGIQMMGVDDFDISRIHSFLDAKPSVPVHCDFDIDSLDASLVPGTSTPVDGGFTVDQAHSILELLRDSGRVTSLDFVEFNPSVDKSGQTLSTALGLLTTYFSK
ncbi:MAG: arginase [Erysipelothrix sp.]|nr:arginase [Erysipelothrix sp.]